jgi:hypothetical protein
VELACLIKPFPREMHLVAVQAKENKNDDDWQLCVTQAALLHNVTQETSGCLQDKHKSMGILSKATTWRFL